MEYEEKDFKKTFRHLASHLEAYYCVRQTPISVKSLKKILMDDFMIPESTARIMLKDLTTADNGLLWYDNESDQLSRDDELIDDFYDNLNFLLGDDRKVRELKEQLSILNSICSEQKYRISNLEKQIDYYRKQYDDFSGK